MKRKKRLWLLTLIILGIVAISLIVIWRLPVKPSPPGASLTQKDMIKQVRYFNHEDYKIVHVGVFDSETFFTVIDQKGAELTPNTSVVRVTLRNRKVSQIKEPYEVFLAMRVWLYLKDRVPQKPVDMVIAMLDRKWVIDATRDAFVTRKEFEAIYPEAAATGATGDQLIEQLAAIWVERTQYKNGWGD